jgi:hypothetical protein
MEFEEGRVIIRKKSWEGICIRGEGAGLESKETTCREEKYIIILGEKHHFKTENFPRRALPHHHHSFEIRRQGIACLMKIPPGFTLLISSENQAGCAPSSPIDGSNTNFPNHLLCFHG